MLPLPDVITEQLVLDNAPSLSAAYYKWADVYENNFEALKSNKEEFLRTFLQWSRRVEYADALSERIAILAKVGRSMRLRTVSRLVFGIGYSHPLENGFDFEWTSGMPVIPGSSLKGLAHFVAVEVMRGNEQVEGLTLTQELTDAVFGTKDSEGKVMFLPGCPVIKKNRPFLDLDLMTPHYGEYYRDPDKCPPADWYDPEPHIFLCVPSGIEYTFTIALCDDFHETESELIQVAFRLLRHGLLHLGIGAKSNVGYGRFEEIDNT